MAEEGTVSPFQRVGGLSIVGGGFVLILGAVLFRAGLAPSTIMALFVAGVVCIIWGAIVAIGNLGTPGPMDGPATWEVLDDPRDRR